VAYNDFAWAAPQLQNNITTITSPNLFSLPETGFVVDYATGSETNVRMTVSGGKIDGTAQLTMHGADVVPGTDAYDVFFAKVSTIGTMSYEAAVPLAEIAFSGLVPGRCYELVFYANRSTTTYGWDRASRIVLVGADSFTNQSSVATDNPDPVWGGALFAGPDAAETRLPADNDNGYVARFVDVDAGEDGALRLQIVWDGASTEQYNGKYANALMLAEH
jgi:hypothetical protein